MADTAANAVLVVNDRTYDIVAGPSVTDELVLKARGDVMQNLSLEQILTDLERTNDLLHVAACGVAGYGNDLSAKVAKLQYGLLTSCSDSMSAMLTFKDAAESVLSALRRAFRELYNLREDRTIIVLARCEQYAKTMAATADKLAGGFRVLADGAEEALESTLTTRDMSEQEREEAEKRKAKAAADKVVEEENKRVLAEQIAKAQKLYEEAKAEQAKAEDRALALEIVGSITGAIGSGVAAFAAIKGAPVLAASSAASALAEIATSKKKRAQAAKIATETRSAGTDKGKDKGKAVEPPPAPSKPDKKKDKGDAVPPAPPTPNKGKGKAVEPPPAPSKPDKKKDKGDAVPPAPPTPDKGKDGKPTGSDKPAGTKPKADDKPKDVKPKDDKPADEKPQKKSAEEKARDDKNKAAIATGVGKAVTEAGDGIKKAGGSYSEIAKRAAEAKKQALDRLMKLQDQEREALVAISRYAEAMTLAAKDADGAKAAVASLQQAVAALKQIVTILENAKLFWEMMARACAALGKDDLREDIKMYMEDPKEDRIAEYSRDEFKAQLLLLTARWVALGAISGEYQDAIAKIREKVQGRIKTAPTIEEARKLAPDLAKQLKLDIEKDLAELDKKRGTTKDEHAALPA